MFQIIGQHDSYYEFVVAVAQRAREISELAGKGRVNLDEKPVKIAVEEFSSGKVKVEEYV